MYFLGKIKKNFVVLWIFLSAARRGCTYNYLHIIISWLA